MSTKRTSGSLRKGAIWGLDKRQARRWRRRGGPVVVLMAGVTVLLDE